MAFTFSNVFTPELSKSPLEGLISNALSGYEQGVKLGYLPSTLAEQLKKAQLENKWYEPNIKSEIGLRGAHAGLLGEQTKGARIENQYLPQYKEAQIEQLKAAADKARLLQMIREQMFSGGPNAAGMLTPEAPNADGIPAPRVTAQGQGMLSNPELMRPESQGGQFGNMPSYAQAVIASQALGYGMPKIVEANGKYVALTPWGGIDTGVQGLTEKQKTLAKEDAKKISRLEDAALGGSGKSDTLNELNTDLGSQMFTEIRQNPILGRHEIEWYEKFGTPEQQEIIGRIKTNMGSIIKESARDFGGQFRVGEQALLNDMKPNVGDSLNVMKGKAEALTFINTIMMRRAELEADYMRNYGLSALQAKIAADKKINPKEIKQEISTILHPASSSKITPDEARAELERRRMGGR